MIQALILAFEQLGDRRIQRPLLWTILLAMAASALLIAGVSAAFALLEFSGITFIDWALALLGGIAAAFVAWMLFPILAAEFLYIFVDRVADAVEARHYPRLPPPHPASFWQYTVAGIRLALLMAFFNLLLLPLSFVPFAQVIYPVLYFTINGVLLRNCRAPAHEFRGGAQIATKAPYQNICLRRCNCIIIRNSAD